VFSIETDAVRSRVRVYEGVVEVEQAGQTHALLAGALWDSASESTNLAMATPAALAQSIEVALRERAGTVFEDNNSYVPASATPTPRSIPRATTAKIAATKDVPITAPWSTDAVPLAKLSTEQLLATARADLKTGKFGDALDAAKLATPWSGAWWQVVADAHRGAGDTSDAADAYDHAAKLLTGADRNEAGYSAAYLRFRDLHQHAGALASLDAAGADAAGSPLEERALGLRAQILVALGRRDDAKAIARRYLAQFPHADLRPYMLALTK
jgi:tetratricopeptide (TPR) repeat protein